jgi:hypothetical protein
VTARPEPPHDQLKAKARRGNAGLSCSIFHTPMKKDLIREYR